MELNIKHGILFGKKLKKTQSSEKQSEAERREFDHNSIKSSTESSGKSPTVTD